MRGHNETEAQLLEQEEATVYLAEPELARAMSRDVLGRAMAPAASETGGLRPW